MPKAPNLILPAGRSSLGKPESWPLRPDAARILARIAPTAIPVLCIGTSGTAFARVAHAIHRASGRAALERVDLTRGDVRGLLRLPRGTPTAHLTLALDGIEALDADGRRWLASYLEHSSPRLVSASRTGTDDLERAFEPDLLSQLAVVTISLPGLAARAHELPALAEDRLRTLAAELAVEPVPTLSTDAAEALSRHDWPGDVTELDAVLLAALLRENPSDPIRATDLAWRRAAPTPSAPAAAPSSEASPTERDRPTLPTIPPVAAELGPLESLESVAVELAHQLKNPLVTVKTFVANASRMDDDERRRFREIALEGIDRIDGPLDQILDFSRLGASTDDSLQIATELETALEPLLPSLREKGVVIQGLPATSLPARGSRPNLEFALRTLWRHVADAIEPHGILTLSRPASDVVLVRYRESSAAANLRGATRDPDSSFPLALLLVRGALTRMGAGLRTSHAQNEVTIELSFTPA